MGAPGAPRPGRPGAALIDEMRSVTMTTAKFRRVTWQWANPLWWAERQLEAAACAMRMTEVVVDASLSSVLGVAGRTVSPPAASVPAARPATAAAHPFSPGGQPASCPPACVPVPAAETVTAPVAAPVPSVVPVPVPVPPWEAAEPRRELAAVEPKPELEAVKRGPQLNSVKPEAEPEAPAAGPRLGAAAAAGPNGSERAPAGDPPVPGWDELTLGSIRARLRRLSEDDLVALHDYEERHAGRADVLSMLQNRLTKVRSADQGS